MVARRNTRTRGDMETGQLSHGHYGPHLRNHPRPRPGQTDTKFYGDRSIGRPNPASRLNLPTSDLCPFGRTRTFWGQVHYPSIHHLNRQYGRQWERMARPGLRQLRSPSILGTRPFVHLGDRSNSKSKAIFPCLNLPIFDLSSNLVASLVRNASSHRGDAG
jgi:hypothetical protein